MPQQKLWTPEFIGMGLTNFFYFMSQYILIAALPVFIMDDLGDGQLAAGMAMTCFQIGTVCTRPIAGRIIDGVNKQKLLLISTVFFVLIMGGFLLASNLHMVYGLRLVHGIVFAIGTTASAAMAALVLPAKRKGEGIGYFAVSGNMAMVIGPLVGLLIIGWFGSKMLFGFLCLLAIAAVIAGNRKRLPDDVVKPSGEKKKGIHVSDFFEKKALPFVILGGLVFFAYGGVLTFIPMYTRSMGLASWTSLFFVVFAIGTTASAAMAALVLPAKRKGEGIGYFAVSGNMAMVIGPLVGLLIIGWFGSKMLFGFLCLLAIAAVIAGNRKRLPDDVVKPSGEKKKGIHVSDFFEKKALPFVILGGLVFFAYGGVLTFIPMYTRSMGLASWTSLFFVVFAIVIVVTRPFVGYLFDYHGPDYTVYPGFGLFALGFILFSQAHSPFTLLFSGTILGVGFGALAPAFQTLAVQSAPAARAGVATSTYFWSLDISVGLAAAILGAVAGSEGYPFMYGVVCLASALAGLAYYFFWRKTSGKRVMKRAAVEA